MWGRGVWLRVRAQVGVRDKSKVGSGRLQKRVGHMQLLVPRWSQWEGSHWDIKVSGLCRSDLQGQGAPNTPGLLGLRVTTHSKEPAPYAPSPPHSLLLDVEASQVN